MPCVRAPQGRASEPASTREAEAERERGKSDADDDEHVAPHAVGNGLVALRHPDGADGPPVVEHGHGGEEKLLAERVAVPRALP